MKKHKLLITLALVCSAGLTFAQSSETVRKYIATYKDVAIAEEIRTGVPAAITLAQGIHETSAGTSDLVIESNNHFGIKCKSDWTGATVYHDDDARGECFRKYDDPAQSYRDHSDFLKNRPNYADLFRLDPTDYKAWAFGLKRAGYATNPRYPQILIKLIEDYDLEDYTTIALKGGNQPGATWASTVSTATSQAPTPEPAVVRTVSYPTGTFRINATSVIYVPKGTSFLKIAEENNISLNRLFDFNDMNPADVTDRDMLLFLQRKRKTGASEFHIVAPGESLYDIAQEEGIRVENLLDYNQLQPSMQPQAGEKLYLQDKAPSMPRLVSTAAYEARQTADTDSFVLHTVQTKETMYAIAKKYGATVEDVMKWNGLQTIDVKPGQQLKINKKSANVIN